VNESEGWRWKESDVKANVMGTGDLYFPKNAIRLKTEDKSPSVGEIDERKLTKSKEQRRNNA
jgi:hypothetical protein